MAASTAVPSPEQLQTLLNRPAGTSPTGVVPNFQNPPNLKAFLPLTLALAMSFGTLAVCIRMYTKLFIIRSVAYEDCMFLQPIPFMPVLNLLRCRHVRMGKHLG